MNVSWTPTDRPSSYNPSSRRVRARFPKTWSFLMSDFWWVMLNCWVQLRDKIHTFQLLPRSLLCPNENIQPPLMACFSSHPLSSERNSLFSSSAFLRSEDQVMNPNSFSLEKMSKSFIYIKSIMPPEAKYCFSGFVLFWVFFCQIVFYVSLYEYVKLRTGHG